MERISALYREHAPALLGYLQRAFGRAGSAEDMLQETFLRALQAADRLASATSPRAWLFGIARHVGLDAIRRGGRQRPLPQELSAPPAAAGDRRLDQVRRAIECLPAEQRETLELRITGGLTYEEIAAALDVPIGTVRSRLHNALRRLREGLKDIAGE
jgi:RNA polymerase sigma-70 factor (ECF subfamily)